MSDALRVLAFAGAPIDIYLTLEVALVYQLRIWPEYVVGRGTERYHQHPSMVWGMGISFMALLAVSMGAVYGNLGEPLRPSVILTLIAEGFAFWWLIGLRTGYGR